MGIRNTVFRVAGLRVSPVEQPRQEVSCLFSLSLLSHNGVKNDIELKCAY